MICPADTGPPELEKSDVETIGEQPFADTIPDTMSPQIFGPSHGGETKSNFQGEVPDTELKNDTASLMTDGVLNTFKW